MKTTKEIDDRIQSILDNLNFTAIYTKLYEHKTFSDHGYYFFTRDVSVTEAIEEIKMIARYVLKNVIKSENTISAYCYRGFSASKIGDSIKLNFDWPRSQVSMTAIITVLLKGY